VRAASAVRFLYKKFEREDKENEKKRKNETDDFRRDGSIDAAFHRHVTHDNLCGRSRNQ
jgi:hypothetical protein